MKKRMEEEQNLNSFGNIAVNSTSLGGINDFCDQQAQQQAALKQKRMQFVQYECIKSELKDEYDKKVSFLHKRLSKKGQSDPSFFLMNSMTDDVTMSGYSQTMTSD